MMELARGYMTFPKLTHADLYRFVLLDVEVTGGGPWGVHSHRSPDPRATHVAILDRMTAVAA